MSIIERERKREREFIENRTDLFYIIIGDNTNIILHINFTRISDQIFSRAD